MSTTTQPLSTCAPTKNVQRTQFQRLQLLRFPRPKLQETNEARYWKKFKLSAAHKLDFLVSNVDISPAKPHDILATSGGKLSIYNARNHRLERTITKFASTASCGVYRGDGKLIGAGSGKVVKVFQAEQSGPAMRVFKGHSDDVLSVGFSLDKVRVLSGAQDKTAKFWDLATGECLRTLRGHGDYVKSLTAHPTNGDLWLTGAYDHLVKLWDVRVAPSSAGSGSSGGGGGAAAGSGSDASASLTIDHGEPVEKVAVLPGGNIVLSAGGNVVKAWDLLTGGQLLHTFSAHQKTVTSLAVDGTGSRMLSGGLDGHIKIHDLTTYRISHALKYQVSDGRVSQGVVVMSVLVCARSGGGMP
jgi:U3 small nucleolar RNA-associated protein 15